MISFSICGSTRHSLPRPSKLFEAITPQRVKSFKKFRFLRKETSATSVVQSMKPLREFFGMFRDRSVRAFLAACTAVACMLGPAGPAVASGGADGPAAAGPQCCSAAPAREPAMLALGNRSIGEATRDAAADVWSSPGASGSSHDRLAQSEPSPASQPSESEQAPEGAPKQNPGDTASESPNEEDSAPFRGSAEPAGPDLSVDEERDLISRGWD